MPAQAADTPPSSARTRQARPCVIDGDRVTARMPRGDPVVT
jgi:hypothetical protein